MSDAEIKAQLAKDFSSEPWYKQISSIETFGGTVFVQMPTGAQSTDVMPACVAVRRIFEARKVKQLPISVMAGGSEAADAIPGRNDGRCQLTQ